MESGFVGIGVCKVSKIGTAMVSLGDAGSVG